MVAGGALAAVLLPTRRSPPGPTWRVPLPPAHTSSGDGPMAPAPPSRPPRCLSLLAGGRCKTLLLFSAAAAGRATATAGRRRGIVLCVGAGEWDDGCVLWCVADQYGK